MIFQKIPLKYYVSGATLIWSFLTLIHLTCQNYSQLAAVRFLLGLCESGVTPCLAHTIAMWFTPEEQAIVAPVFWISSSGQGLFGGPISYGVQFVQGVSPWKIYWTIIGVLTFVVSMSSLIFYPSNPASFWIFTPVERVHIIKRIKSKTNSSIEQKVVKREQIVEALKDPITWLFFWFVFFNMFSNNISFQSAIIYKNLGFSNLQSTLVAIASAGYSTVAAVVGSTILSRYKAQSAHVGTAFLIIALLGCILVIALPLSQSYGILAGTFLTHSNSVTFIAALSWCQSSAAGYTKRLVRTIVWSIGYAVMNMLAPQFWRQQDQPRYYMAWGLIIAFTCVLSPCTLQLIRFILSRRNKERLQLLKDIADNRVEDTTGFVIEIDDDGNEVKKSVDISMLDLTDLQNKKFIYPL